MRFWPFKKKHPKDKLSIGRLFPVRRARAAILRIGLGIGEAFLIGLGITGTLAVAGGIAIDVAIAVGLSFAATMLSQAFMKKPSGASVLNNGRQINTRSTSQPVNIVYGICKVGGNWGYPRERGIGR